MDQQREKERAFSGKFRRILAGHLIDGTGSPARRDVLMTIDEGRIAEMRPFRPDETSGDLWLDLSGCTVMPPLIDCHAHLAISGALERHRKTHRRPIAYEALTPTISRHIQECLQSGVICVRDGGDPSENTLRYKAAALKTEDDGFRLNTGAAWHREGRYGRSIGRAVPAGADPLAVIAGGTGTGADHIKLIQSGLNSLTDFGRQTPPQFDADAIRRIYTLSRNRGIGLMVHANGEAPVAEAIAGGCDSIEHGYFMGEENLLKMADARITWVPTAVPMKAYADHSPKGSTESDVALRTLDHQLEQLYRARRCGVPVALGTDSGSPGVLHGRSTAGELNLLVAAGYTLEEAVSSATRSGARLLKSDLTGTLAAGMPATFIAVKGEVLNALEAGGIEMMMVEGRVLKSA